MDELELEHVSRQMYVARTPHVNWVLHTGDDGITLVDSGYAGQFELLLRSLQQLDAGPGDVRTVLVTHAHADHLGGAARLSRDHGVPVLTAPAEVPHLRREYVQQVGIAEVLRRAYRPRVVRWARQILPLTEGDPTMGIPEARGFDLVDGRIDLPGRPEPILVHGHTSGHVAYEFGAEGVLVLGDAVATGHPTTGHRGPQLLPSMFHHDPAMAGESVSALAGSSAEVMVPGHGPVWRGPAAQLVAETVQFGAAW